jgi:hypothetical protein
MSKSNVLKFKVPADKPQGNPDDEAEHGPGTAGPQPGDEGTFEAAPETGAPEFESPNPDEDEGDAEDKSISPEELKQKRKELRNKLIKRLWELNKKYMVVNEGGKLWVYNDTKDHVLERRIYRAMRYGDVAGLYANELIGASIDNEGRIRKKPVFEVWWKHKIRRQFIEGVIFDPSGRKPEPGYLNLWRGFGVEPKEGSWDKLKTHIRVVICDNDEECFEYFMNWLAYMIQHPEKQGEVAIVLRGGRGAGKGTLGHAIRKILGQHGFYINSSKHLVGHFNEHLRDCVFLFADEAFFAGDKAGLGTLKSIITDPVLNIEGKFKTAQQFANHLHIFMASNSDWVVPAGTDERRFFVLDVSDRHKQDHEYFGAIHQELENGGYEAMLHELLHRNISMVNIRAVPQTEALQDQKKHSLETQQTWWLEVLERGYVYKSKLGLESYFGEWHDWVATEVLFASYQDFAKAKGERHPLGREQIGRFLVDSGARPQRPRGDFVVGEHVVPTFDGVGSDKNDLVMKARPTGYHLGELKLARAAFEKATGLTFDWGVTPEDERE